MSPELRQVFIRDVIATPDDDSPRLIFADALEEAGESEYSEFIRVQCELAHGCNEEKRDILRRREKELARIAVYKRWFPAKCKWWLSFTSDNYDSRWSCYLVRRGFIDEVHCVCAEWLQHGPAIVAEQPVARVMLTDKRPLTGVKEPQMYRWTATEELDQPSIIWNLPLELFLALLAGPYRSPVRDASNNRASSFYIQDYASEAAALSALSDAALAWAKRCQGDEQTRRCGAAQP